MMKLAQDRDIIKCNIDLADNFSKIKFEQIETSVIYIFIYFNPFFMVFFFTFENKGFFFLICFLENYP